MYALEGLSVVARIWGLAGSAQVRGSRGFSDTQAPSSPATFETCPVLISSSEPAGEGGGMRKRKEITHRQKNEKEKKSRKEKGNEIRQANSLYLSPNGMMNCISHKQFKMCSL